MLRNSQLVTAVLPRYDCALGNVNGPQHFWNNSPTKWTNILTFCVNDLLFLVLPRQLLLSGRWTGDVSAILLWTCGRIVPVPVPVYPCPRLGQRMRIKWHFGLELPRRLRVTDSEEGFIQTVGTRYTTGTGTQKNINHQEHISSRVRWRQISRLASANLLLVALHVQAG